MNPSPQSWYDNHGATVLPSRGELITTVSGGPACPVSGLAGQILESLRELAELYAHHFHDHAHNRHSRESENIFFCHRAILLLGIENLLATALPIAPHSTSHDVTVVLDELTALAVHCHRRIRLAAPTDLLVHHCWEKLAQLADHTPTSSPASTHRHGRISPTTHRRPAVPCIDPPLAVVEQVLVSGQHSTYRVADLLASVTLRLRWGITTDTLIAAVHTAFGALIDETHQATPASSLFTLRLIRYTDAIHVQLIDTASARPANTQLASRFLPSGQRLLARVIGLQQPETRPLHMVRQCTSPPRVPSRQVPARIASEGYSASWQGNRLIVTFPAQQYTNQPAPLDDYYSSPKAARPARDPAGKPTSRRTRPIIRHRHQPWFGLATAWRWPGRRHTARQPPTCHNTARIRTATPASPRIPPLITTRARPATPDS